MHLSMKYFKITARKQQAPDSVFIKVKLTNMICSSNSVVIVSPDNSRSNVSLICLVLICIKLLMRRLLLVLAQ